MVYVLKSDSILDSANDIQDAGDVTETTGPQLTYNFSNVQEMQWIQGDLVEQKRNFPSSEYRSYKDKTECDLFELFFDKTVFNLLL